MSECSLLSEQPSREEIFIAARLKFGKTNVMAKEGEIYILGPNGSHYVVTTYEELKRVPSSCGNSMAMPPISLDMPGTSSDVPGKAIQTDDEGPIPIYLLTGKNKCSLLPKHKLADAFPGRLKK